MPDKVIVGLIDIAKQVFEKNGLVGFIFFAIFMVALYYAVELIKISIKTKFIQKKVLRKKDTVNLKNHSVFKTIRNLIDYKVDSIKCNCPLRKSLFKTILKIRYETMYKNLMSLTSENWNIPSDESKEKWDAFFAKTQHDWITECYAKDVPKIAIQKYIELYGKINGIIEDTVENVCLKPSFSNSSGADMIFTLIPTMELSAFYALDETLNSLNGELSKETFNGISCNQCDSCKRKIIK